MSTEHEEHGLLHLPHRKTHKASEEDTAGADEFVDVHEVEEVPWDPDEPVVREDERYDRLAGTDLFPSERAIDPRLLP